MKKLLTILLALATILPAYSQKPAQWNTPGAGNPLIPGYFADPTVRKFGDTYYIYATTDGTAGGLGPSQVWKSKDFVNWTIEPMNWPTTRQVWAPDVMQGTDGRYYFYYSQACKIYCAVADSPAGPWTNILGADEAVLIPNLYIHNSITLDAQSFIDDDGSTYLNWGTWGIYKGHGCSSAKLNPDMKTFADTLLIPNTDLIDFFEAPYMFKRNGVYYLTYSSGSCHDGTYRVQYATSTVGPTGPFTFADNNPILEKTDDKTVWGPGHHSILEQDGEYYIVYHRHNIPMSTRGFHRQVAVNRMTFDAEGRINKVIPAHSGVGFLAPDSNPYKNLTREKKVKVTASSYYNDNFKPEYAADDNNATLWRAANNLEPQWLQIDLGKPRPVHRIWTQFEHATAFYQYIYETSTDGINWTTFSDQRLNIHAGSPRIDRGEVKARYIRLTITGCEKNGFIPAVWNIKVFADGVDPFENNTRPFNKQDTVAAPARKGLLFTLNADDYKEDDVLGRISTSADATKGFNAEGMAVEVKTHRGKRAFAFNGRQEFTSDFGLETINVNSPYTISAWVSSAAPKENEIFIDLNTSWHELGKITVGYGTSDRSGITLHNGWYEDMGLDSIPKGDDWQHLVVTFDGYMEKLYLNGRLVKEKDIFLLVGPCDKMTLGCKHGGEFPFAGYLHKLEVYDVALVPEVIPSP